MKNLLLEACVETLEEAILAEQKGADRIELCSRLDLDGLTPELELINQVLKNVSIPVKVMIRPRGGNFIYNNDELRQMKNKIQQFRQLKIQGLVFGILEHKNRLNLNHIQELANLSYPMEVTIHKAIDLTPNLLESVSELIQIPGITSILTSGGTPTAKEGSKMLKKMIHLAGNSLNIIPAGRITNQNISVIHELIGAKEYHGRRIAGSLY